MTPDDDQREADFFDAQTVRERVMRFMGVTSSLSHELIWKLTHIDFGRDFAIVAVDRATDALVGIARYVREEEPNVASPAVAVLKSYQRLGLGRYLVAAVFDAAREAGIRTLVAEILLNNVASRQLFDKVAQQAGARKRFVGADGDVTTFHYYLRATDAGVAPSDESRNADSAGPVPPEPPFTVDRSRHPKSLWRHDLVYPSGLRIEVRPSDIDDRQRVEAFREAVERAGGEAAEQRNSPRDLLDFTTGFTLVAIDLATDAIVSAAHFHRGADWSKMNVLTAPEYRGLGIADFLAQEVLRAARTEVVPRPLAAL